MTIRTFRSVSALMLPLALSAVGCAGTGSATSPSNASGSDRAVSADSHGAPSNPAINAAEVNGAVQTINVNCAGGLRFTVAGRLIVTNASTQFADGACADVHVGTMVEVKGTAQADGSVVAARVEIRGVPENEPNDPNHADDPDDHPDANQPEDHHGANEPGDDHGGNEPNDQRGPNGNEPHDQREVTGVIGNTSGGCPSLTLTVGSTTVRTNSSTSFHDVACTALVNGVRVEVKGQVVSGALVATRVERK